MRKRQNGTLIKVLILAPYLVLLYILQGMVFTRLELLGVKPLLLPLAVAGVALFRGRIEGGVFGLFAGIFMDLSFNQLTVQFTLILTFTGFLLGLLSDTVLVQGFPSYLLSCLLELVLCGAFQVLTLMVLRGAPLRELWSIALDQTLYSLIFTVPIYYVSRFLSRVM